jgi:amino acid permease
MDRQKLLEQHEKNRDNINQVTGTDDNDMGSSNFYVSPKTGQRKSKFADIMLSPVRYGQRKFRPGGTSGSIFSLIAATLGSGTISFSYAVMMNGYILGPVLIIFGALISFYTGMLIVKCAEHTGRTRYEDIALALYGKKWSRVTSYLNLICLIGFTFSYIVYVKKAVPQIIEMYACPGRKDKDSCNGVSEWLYDTSKGETFWGIIFSFAIAFPMSIPRNASSLRFSSLFGVLCSMYLCIAVTLTFFLNKKVV